MKPCQSTLAFLLDSWLSRYIEQQQLIGLSVAVGHNATSIYQNSFGLADVEQGIKCTSKTQFCIGSQSKMITTVMVLLLAEQHYLSIDDTIEQHLPWAREHPDKRFGRITIRQLLHHSSGMPREGNPADHWLLHQPYPDTMQLHKMCLAARLKAIPGERVYYSNLGYAIIGQIIESAYGKSYEDCATELVIEPLGLAATSPNVPSDKASVAAGYTHYIDGVRRPFQQIVDTRTFAAVTGWYSNPSDMLSVMDAIINKDRAFLADQSRRILLDGIHQHYSLAPYQQTAYTHGLMKFSPDNDLVGHSGAYHGHQSVTMHNKKTGLTVAVTANSIATPAVAIASCVIDMAAFLLQHKALSTAAHVDGYGGVFTNPHGQRIILPLQHPQYASMSLESHFPLDTVALLTVQHPNQLLIESANYLDSSKETVTYYHDGSVVNQIDYAGIKAWPIYLLSNSQNS